MFNNNPESSLTRCKQVVLLVYRVVSEYHSGLALVASPLRLHCQWFYEAHDVYTSRFLSPIILVTVMSGALVMVLVRCKYTWLL